jgi:predicted ribosome quality control (RQC) complex YloA/Tae2 family protein
MSLSASELVQVVAALRPLTGAVVQKAYVPRERVLLLELRVPGQSHLLLLCAEPGRTRLGLVTGRPPSPSEPLSLQQQARAHLIGRKLTAVTQSEGDRVVTFVFTDAEGERQLVAELTGRHGNLLLLSAGKKILAMGGANLSQARALAVGRDYLPPTSEAKVGSGASSRFEALQGDALFAAIEADYTERDQAMDRETLRARLEKPLKARWVRLQRTLKKVEAEAARTEAAETHRRAGELLKTGLHRVPRGAREVALTEYDAETGEPREVTIMLKPELSAADNLALHFRQYRRLLSGSARAAQRLAQLQEEAAALQTQLTGLATMTLDELAARVRGLPAPREATRTEGPQARSPYREFLAVDGSRIWVGKGAADNDFLSFKQARPHDLWLHARGRTGAHVVVPLSRGAEVKPEVLLDACALALHFSDAKGESRAEVSYLLAKYLRKAKGGRPGAVIYSQEKTLSFVVEPARIARLLASTES